MNKAAKALHSLPPLPLTACNCAVAHSVSYTIVGGQLDNTGSLIINKSDRYLHYV